MECDGSIFKDEERAIFFSSYKRGNLDIKIGCHSNESFKNPHIFGF